MPVLRRIQHAFPSADISWIIGSQIMPLVGDIENVTWIGYDKTSGLQGLVALYHRLNRSRFDVLLQMQTSLRSSIISLGIHAKRRIGYPLSASKDQHHRFVHEYIGSPTQAHVLDTLMGFADALDAPASPLRWDIPIPLDARARINRELRDDLPVMVISPCSSERLRNWRNWGCGRWQSFTGRAQHQWGMQIVLSGAGRKLEHEYGHAISAELSTPPINLIGRINLKELLALLSRASVVICPDSGPVHMATAVGTPVIGLYATSNPDRTGPYLDRRWSINRYPYNVEHHLGRTVHDVKWGQRIRHPLAMESISVEDVLDSLDRLMRQHNQAHET